MERQSGDEYIRQIATFIRANEKSLAESGFFRRQIRGHTELQASTSTSFLKPVGWLFPSPYPKPTTLSLDLHHLFYVLIRMEALGLAVGSLDIHLQSPTRPITYTNIFTDRKESDTLSLASLRSSFSALSTASLGRSWWNSAETPNIDSELKYIFSSFTKLPSLTIRGPERTVISELADDSFYQHAVPLDSFKNLQKLECIDTDPRALLGWDRLSENLRSLKLKNSGLEDISEIFVDAALNRLNMTRGLNNEGIERSIFIDPLPDPSTSFKWAFLKHLYLPDNSLTSFPSNIIPSLTQVTHLDLSSNLLICVPSGFAELYNLTSLNLANNLIESVLGVYLNLGQVTFLNLSGNRLDSLCGLERLLALERVDLRSNLLEESLEIGRLAVLPNLTELWIEGNPFTEIEHSYRSHCFGYFLRERKVISLDGNRQTGSLKKELENLPVILNDDGTGVQSPSPISVIQIDHRDSSSHSLQHYSSHVHSPAISLMASHEDHGRRKKTTRPRVVNLDQKGNRDNSMSGKQTSESLISRPQDHFHTSQYISSNPRPFDLSEEDQRGGSNVDPNSGSTAFSSRRRPRHARSQTDHSPRFSNLFPSEHTSHRTPQHDRMDSDFRLFSVESHKRSNTSSYNVQLSDSGTGLDPDKYRKKIESLKRDMGESWLKIYSQTER